MLMRSSRISDSSGEYLRSRETIVRNDRIERVQRNFEDFVNFETYVRIVTKRSGFKMITNKKTMITKLSMDTLPAEIELIILLENGL